MKVGWAYLGLSVVLVLIGVYLSLGVGTWVGDLLLVASIGFIYLGSTTLASENEAEDAAKRAEQDAESTNQPE